jgi:hypothetical protein
MKVYELIELLQSRPDLHHLEVETPDGNEVVGIKRVDDRISPGQWGSSRPTARLEGAYSE